MSSSPRVSVPLAADRNLSRSGPREAVASALVWTARLPLIFALLYLAQGTILRMILWGAFGPPAGLDFGRLPVILAVGFWGDLRVAAMIFLPLVMFTLLVPRTLLVRRTVRAGVALLSFLFLFGLIYQGAIEYFYFEEFDSRLDLVSVDYLLYPTEVLVNIWESYPVMPVVLLTAALSALILYRLWPKIRTALDRLHQQRERRASLIVALITGLLIVSPHIEGSGFGNRVAEQLADNGLRTFALALRTSEIDYSAYYRTGDPAHLEPLLATWLDPEPDDPAAGDPAAGDPAAGTLGARFRRRIEPTSGIPPRSPNIVVVLEESFGAEFVGAYGDPRGLTPKFDALAEQGVLFRTAYATGTRTVRGIEAVMTSFPPIPTVSIVKRPGSEGIANLGSTLEGLGYRSIFLYGGYGYFDNMNHFFSSNGFEIRDRSDLPEPVFANIWGVSDGDLFDGALDSFDTLAATGQPFVGVVLTTSNHKPFTFPPGVPGVPAEGGGRLAGVRYADHAVGQFVEDAAGHPWFDDTLFVIVADHGARVYGAAEIPLHTYEIPILFYWPDQLAPAVVEQPVSQIDVAPTILGLLGQAYEAPFFGRDALAENPREPLLLFNHNHDVALLHDDQLVILGLQKKVETFRYRASDDSYEPMPDGPDLVELTTAVYQTADALFHRHQYL